MKRLFVLTMIIVLLRTVWLPQPTQAQSPTHLRIDPIEGPVPWTSLDLNNRAENFQFAIVTDRTGGHRPGVFMEGVRSLNLLQPEFVMSVGDLIEGYTEDRSVLRRQWREFDAFVQKLDMPFFYVPGNHDLTNPVMAELWQQRLGPAYYHFVYHDVLFLCLNSEDQYRGAGRGSISDEQYQWARGVLADHPEVRWTLVFLHQPLWHQEDTRRWPELETLLAERPHTVFAGHEHRYRKATRNQGKYFTLATTGGVSGLRGPQMGEFDHVVWVTMTGEGPVIANLLLEGIHDENIMTEERMAFIRRVSSQPPVRIEPIYLRDIEDFEQGTVRIQLTNDQDIPMEVRFEEGFSFDLIGILDRPERTIPPNDVETVTLALQSRNGGHKQPLTLEMDCRYQTSDSQQVSIPFTYRLKPLPRYILEEAPRRVNVDGRDREWPDSLPHGWNAPNGDNRIRFDLRYDNEFLYVVARVEDDTITSLGKGAPWTQDALGMAFSGRAFREAVMSKGRHWYQHEVMQYVTPATDSTETITYRELPQGTFKCVTTDYGYFVEAAFTLEHIRKHQGPDWKTVRFVMNMDDRDGPREARSWWYPNWMRQDNIVGSGMFFRE